MRAGLDIGRAMLRGRYTCAVASVEAAGIPIDLPIVERLRSDWAAIRHHVIQTVDHSHGVHRSGRFDPVASTAWVVGRGIGWPRLNSARLDLGDEAFHEMSRPIRRSDHSGSFGRMLTSGWIRARIKEDLSQVRVHDLKHTFGRRLRAAGVSFEDRRICSGTGRAAHHALLGRRAVAPRRGGKPGVR